jgi:hypothetical protein
VLAFVRPGRAAPAPRAERHDRPAGAAGDHDRGWGPVPEPGPGRLAVGAARSRLAWRIKDLS